MSKLAFIKDRIHSAKQQTEKLLEEIPAESWLHSPKIANTNMNWQIGHLIVANYLHGVASISGANEQVRTEINVADYIKFYGPKSNPLSFTADKPNTEALLKAYAFVFDLISSGLDKLSEDDLLKKTEVPNPVAKNKSQALIRLFEHQMWHNGQIALLNRMLKSNKNE